MSAALHDPEELAFMRSLIRKAHLLRMVMIAESGVDALTATMEARRLSDSFGADTPTETSLAALNDLLPANIDKESDLVAFCRAALLAEVREGMRAKEVLKKMVDEMLAEVTNDASPNLDVASFEAAQSRLRIELEALGRSARCVDAFGGVIKCLTHCTRPGAADPPPTDVCPVCYEVPQPFAVWQREGTSRRLSRFRLPPVKLACSHTFCFRCIHAWMAVHGKTTCPLCRFNAL